MTLQARLERIVTENAWLMRLLRALSESKIPEGYIGAGALRNSVWNLLFGSTQLEHDSDVDVVYYDPRDSARDWRSHLETLAPEIAWEVTNQATVHLWQGQVLGREIPRYPSVTAAVATWPETATAIAIRLLPGGKLDLVAPCGLEDLFSGIVRRNPMTPDPTAFCRRLQQHNWLERWPRLRVKEE